MRCVFRAKLGSIRKTGNCIFFSEIQLSVAKGALSSFVIGPGHFLLLYPLALERMQP